MIEFTAVSREIRSLLSRRRELLTFLGSVFAALGLFLQNVLKGELPDTLKSLEGRVFASYALLLLVPSLILGLRLAKLSAGMTLNGILYARLLQEQTFAPSGNPDAVHRAARVNLFGVSFLMFLLADLLAGFAACLFALAIHVEPVWLCPVVGAVVAVLGLAMYLRFHRQACGYALARTFADTCGPYDRDEWEAHAAESLRDGNHDMITILTLVGLIVFSAFEGMSSLGRATAMSDLPREEVQKYGPLAYGLLMVGSCFFGLVTYIRLRVAIGVRSLQLDPTDRPFRPLKLTDSLLGYMLLAFLFGLSLHFLCYPYLAERTLLLVDVIAFVSAILVEQVTLLIAGFVYRPR